MKKFSLIAAAVLAIASSGAFAAGSANDAFSVTINFTAACKVKTAAKNMIFNYTAFGADVKKTTSTVFECSRGLTPTFNFDDTGVDQTGQTVPVVLGTLIQGEGLIAGVRYTLSGTSTKSVIGTDAAAGAGGTGGTDGSSDEYTVDIEADILKQAGGSGAGGTHARTLVISY